MKKAILITLTIIVLNALFFWYWWMIYIESQNYITHEFLRSIYKIWVYLLPTLLIYTYIWKSDYSSSQLSEKIDTSRRAWPRSLNWSFLYICWWVWTYIITTNNALDHAFIPLIYILVTNSVVEELVFRWYIQKNLTHIYGMRDGIIWQAILFGLVHIPYYFIHYQEGLYSSIDIYISQLLHITTLWPSILLLSLWTPVGLGLIWWYLSHRSWSLWPAIICHSIHNGMIFLM